MWLNRSRQDANRWTSQLSPIFIICSVDIWRRRSNWIPGGNPTKEWPIPTILCFSMHMVWSCTGPTWRWKVVLFCCFSGQDTVYMASHPSAQIAAWKAEAWDTRQGPREANRVLFIGSKSQTSSVSSIDALSYEVPCMGSEYYTQLEQGSYMPFEEYETKWCQIAIRHRGASCVQKFRGKLRHFSSGLCGDMTLRVSGCVWNLEWYQSSSYILRPETRLYSAGGESRADQGGCAVVRCHGSRPDRLHVSEPPSRTVKTEKPASSKQLWSIVLSVGVEAVIRSSRGVLSNWERPVIFWLDIDPMGRKTEHLHIVLVITYNLY